MYHIAKSVSFCYGHRLLDYSGKCRHLHGHNGRAEITLESTRLDRRCMVFDFGDVKGIVGTFIDGELDHKMILCRRDPMLAELKRRGEACFVMEENPTAENIAKLIYDFARSKGLPVASAKLWETETSFAVYDGGKRAGRRSKKKL